MLINLPDEDFAFLKDLAHEIETQNNRSTAKPYYYVVRGKRPLSAPSGFGDRQVWVDMRGPDVYRSKEAAIEGGKTYGLEGEELEEFVNNLQEFGEQDIYEEHNVFLTEKGYLQHMELNDHNYRNYNEPVYSYLKHAFRNPEMKRLIEVILKLGKEEPCLKK